MADVPRLTAADAAMLMPSVSMKSPIGRKLVALSSGDTLVVEREVWEAVVAALFDMNLVFRNHGHVEGMGECARCKLSARADSALAAAGRTKP